MSYKSLYSVVDPVLIPRVFRAVPAANTGVQHILQSNWVYLIVSQGGGPQSANLHYNIEPGFVTLPPDGIEHLAVYGAGCFAMLTTTHLNTQQSGFFQASQRVLRKLVTNIDAWIDNPDAEFHKLVLHLEEAAARHIGPRGERAPFQLTLSVCLLSPADGFLWCAINGRQHLAHHLPPDDAAADIYGFGDNDYNSLCGFYHGCGGKTYEFTLGARLLLYNSAYWVTGIDTVSLVSSLAPPSAVSEPLRMWSQQRASHRSRDDPEGMMVVLEITA